MKAGSPIQPPKPEHWLVRHGTLFIFDAVHLCTLGMVIAAQAWSVLPTFGFIVAINIAYWMAPRTCAPTVQPEERTT